MVQHCMGGVAMVTIDGVDTVAEVVALVRGHSRGDIQYARGGEHLVSVTL